MSILMDPDADMRLKPVADWPTPPKLPRTVLVLMVAFNYDYSRCSNEAQRISRAMRGYPIRAAMHSKRQIAYIIETHMTTRELMKYLAEPLSAGCIERAWSFTVGADVSANMPLDSFTEKVGQAWNSVRRYNSRLHLRALPRELYEHETPIPGNPRGVTVSRILDDHPLDRRG